MSPSASVVLDRVFPSLTTVKQNNLKRKRDDEITQEKAIFMGPMHKEDEYTESSSLSWEVLCLLGHYMDPETLAVASCVSTAWLKCFSSEHLWKSLITIRSAQPSSPYEFALETKEKNISYKHLVSTVETDTKRRRKDHQLAQLKISLSDLSFIIHVSTGTKKASFLTSGKDLEFGPNDKFQIETDVSSSGFTAGEKDVRLTWQVVYKNWEKFFTIADHTAGSLDKSYGWFTDNLENKDSRKLVGDVKPSFNDGVLDKIGFGIVDSDGWGSLLVDGFLRYLQLFLLE